MTPWSALTGDVAPPAWHGPARAHRISDEDPRRRTATARAPAPATEPKPPRRTRRRRVQLQPWMVLTPGSELEAAVLAVPPAAWWPSPHG